MRVITDHHDGHGLNESIDITADELSAGGASHKYEFRIAGELVGSLQFQHGPRQEPESTPGVVEAAVLAVLMDRLQCFQAGPFASRENAIALTHLETALLFIKRRADNRAKCGVLGKNEK